MVFIDFMGPRLNMLLFSLSISLFLQEQRRIESTMNNMYSQQQRLVINVD
jgi:hypothetical protein